MGHFFQIFFKRLNDSSMAVSISIYFKYQQYWKSGGNIIYPSFSKETQCTLIWLYLFLRRLFSSHTNKLFSIFINYHNENKIKGNVNSLPFKMLMLQHFCTNLGSNCFQSSQGYTNMSHCRHNSRTGPPHTDKSSCNVSHIYWQGREL